MKTFLCLASFAILWAAKVLALTSFDQFEIPEPHPLPYPGSPNSTQLAISQLGLRDLLLPRQSTCSYPNGWCSKSGKCCPANATCCPGGCGDRTAGDCCSTGQCNADKPHCCHDKGCLRPEDECCQGSGWCPSPFICVLIVKSGARGCCTDLTCMVYLDMEGDTTVTRTVSTAQATASAQRATTIAKASSTITSAPQASSVYASTNVASGQYQVYDTTVRWTYWYYFYTRTVIGASTTTSRYLTTVTKTTTLTCQATASVAAQASFDSMSRDLPTPSDAEIAMASIPTPSALIVGSCVSSRVSDSATSVCETDIAPSISRSSSTSSTSGGSTSYDGTSMTDASSWRSSVVASSILAIVSGVLMLLL